MRNIKLIIPMSGIGKRFIESGYTLPKFLIETIKNIGDIWKHFDK